MGARKATREQLERAGASSVALADQFAASAKLQVSGALTAGEWNFTQAAALPDKDGHRSAACKTDAASRQSRADSVCGRSPLALPEAPDVPPAPRIDPETPWHLLEPFSRLLPLRGAPYIMSHRRSSLAVSVSEKRESCGRMRPLPQGQHHCRRLIHPSANRRARGIR